MVEGPTAPPGALLDRAKALEPGAITHAKLVLERITRIDDTLLDARDIHFPSHHRLDRHVLPELDLLLLQFLQELLFYKDAQRLLLRVYAVQITTHDQRFALEARAAGEPLDPARHALGADVKGVTLHRLQVVQTSNGWEATVVLDV